MEVLLSNVPEDRKEHVRKRLTTSKYVPEQANGKPALNSYGLPAKMGALDTVRYYTKAQRTTKPAYSDRIDTY